RVVVDGGVVAPAGLGGAEPAGERIGFDAGRADPFGPPTLDPAPRGVHLPEAILSMDVALREECIARAARPDVGDAPFVAEYCDRLVKPGKLCRHGCSGAMNGKVSHEWQGASGRRARDRIA